MIRAENQFELTFPAKSENEGFARQCVAMFLSRLDPTVGELADLRTAVSEAVTNCVVHAYKGMEEGKVYINVRIFENRRVVIRIKDTGCGMADPEKCKTPLYSTDQSGRYGLYDHGELYRQNEGENGGREGHYGSIGKETVIRGPSCRMFNGIFCFSKMYRRAKKALWRS